MIKEYRNLNEERCKSKSGLTPVEATILASIVSQIC
jgi:hypothetical protein